MIKFFRKIRQRLLSENRFSKYFLYAIGEIILVVIGILIALQINTWNEDRKGRNEETKILKSLLEDFRETQSNLETSLERFPEDISRLDTVVNYFGYDEALTPGMKKNLLGSGYITTKFVQERLVGLLSSENFQLINNDELKKRLTTYPSQIRTFKERELDAKNLVLDRHRPKQGEYLSFTDLNLISKNLERYPNMKTWKSPSDYEGLLRDRDYQNIIVDEMWHVRILSHFAEDLLTETKEIAEIIENELRTRD